MQDLNTSEAPKLGAVILVHGHPFTVVEVRDYQRKDGNVVPLVTWSTRCTECGVEVRFVRGLTANGISFRCEAHKRPGKPATAGAKLALRDAAKRGREKRKENLKRDKKLKRLGLL